MTEACTFSEYCGHFLVAEWADNKLSLQCWTVDAPLSSIPTSDLKWMAKVQCHCPLACPQLSAFISICSSVGHVTTFAFSVSASSAIYAGASSGWLGSANLSLLSDICIGWTVKKWSNFINLATSADDFIAAFFSWHLLEAPDSQVLLQLLCLSLSWLPMLVNNRNDNIQSDWKVTPYF